MTNCPPFLNQLEIDMKNWQMIGPEDDLPDDDDPPADGA